MWRKDVEAHLRVLEHIKADDGFEALVEEIASTLCSAVAKGGKIILFGNGGSAADAQHIAAEFVGRFNFDRAAINAVALTTNPSIVTAIANDFDFSSVFARQVSAIVIIFIWAFAVLINIEFNFYFRFNISSLS